MVSSLPPRPLRWIIFSRHCSRRRSRQGGQRGRIVVVVSTSPSSPATDWRAKTCSKGPSIVFVAAMLAVGDHGLPWRRAGWQWLRLPVAIKMGGCTVRKRFCHSRTPGGQKLSKFCRRYRIAPHVRYAVASRKRGEKVMVESAPPRQSVVRLFPLVLLLLFA